MLDGTILLADDIYVRIDRAADDTLPQAPARVDDDHVAITGHRIGGEYNCGGVGDHHLLHQHCYPHILYRQALLAAIFYSLWRGERLPAAPSSLQKRFKPDNIEKGLVLAGK
jgi:hypothetical protein